MNTYIYAYKYAYIHICIYIHIYTHTHANTHIHIFEKNRNFEESSYSQVLKNESFKAEVLGRTPMRRVGEIKVFL